MSISVFQAILLGLCGALVGTSMFPLGWLSQNIMSKPLIACMIIGIIMGDVSNALIIGSVIQSAYIGQMAIGGVSTLPTINTSLWFALPLMLVSGGDAAECLTICLAFAAVETITGTIGNLVKVGVLHTFDSRIEAGKIKQWWFPILGHVWTFAYYMIVVVSVCLLGQDFIINLVAKIPAWVSGATSTFTNLLPAIGFMMLMDVMLHNGWQWIYFMVGWTLVAGLGWSTLYVTVFGCLIAYMIFLFTPSSAAAEEEDDD